MHFRMHYINEYSFDDLYTAISYIKWSKIIVESMTLSEMVDDIINSKNKYYAYFYCLRFKFKIKKIQEFILNEKDPKFAFLFYRDIKCNKSSMRKIILNSNSTKYLTKLVELNPKYLKNAEKEVIKKNDAFNALNLLKMNSNNKRLYNIVLKSNKPKHWLSLAKITNNKEILNVIEDKLMQINHFKYLTYMAMKSKCDVNKIEKFIRASGDTSDALFFARKVKKSNLHELLVFI